MAGECEVLCRLMGHHIHLQKSGAFMILIEPVGSHNAPFGKLINHLTFYSLFTHSAVDRAIAHFKNPRDEVPGFTLEEDEQGAA